MSDLDSFTREDAEAFYKRYYVPSNMVTAIVGDVKATEIIPVLDKLLRPHPEGGPAPAAADRGAAADRREDRPDSRPGAADLRRGLSQGGGDRPR